ncbi:hypothetical protein pb186bvf_002502 [Paramecium bursaria]
MDNNKVFEKIPLISTQAGPRYFINQIKGMVLNGQINEDNDWVKIEATNKEQTKWKGKCWYIHNFVKYDFDLQFEVQKHKIISQIPATYPLTPIEIELPQLDGMTQKMYRGGKICIDIHFAPLWQKNAPKFGIVHALALALGPWLAAEIPILIEEGKIKKE